MTNNNELISDRERNIVKNLITLATKRDEAESTVTRSYKSDRSVVEREFEEAIRFVDSRFETEDKATEEDHATALAGTRNRYDDEIRQLEKEYRGKRFKISEQADHDENKAKKAWDEARWTADTVFEAKERQPQEKFHKVGEKLRKKYNQFQSMELHAADLLRRYKQSSALKKAVVVPVAASVRTEDKNPTELLEEQSQIAAECLNKLRKAHLARLFDGIKPFLIFVLPFTAAGALNGWLTDWKFDELLVECGVSAGVAAIALLIVIYIMGRKQVVVILSEMNTALEEARHVREQCLALASEVRATEETEIKQQYDEEILTARETYGPQIERVQTLRKKLRSELEGKYSKLLSDKKEERAKSLEDIEERYQLRKKDVRNRYEKDSQQLREKHKKVRNDQDQQHQKEWDELEVEWKSGMAEIGKAVHELDKFDRSLFPSWLDPVWANWVPPKVFAPAIRYGHFDINLEMIPGGIPKDERLLNVGPLRFSLPAILDFPKRSSLLIEANEEYRDIAVETLQNVMLRLLTTLPPGKVRFTIVDPVGLGQNFAGFMHLADYEEAFVADRIWTESRHIEQRLLDITEHMENVIQKYLRNDFESITDYNEHAGEIAEPFRFLVIANFPVNFSDTAARRLVSIIDSGPRCGVYTLISVDKRHDMPRNFQPEDLRRSGVTLIAEKDRIYCNDEVFKNLPLALDAPPTPEFLTDTLHVVGESAMDSSRVEVPFEHVVPQDEKYWTEKSDREFSVALGRAGATKLQKLSLGRGISQHMLIAGKTGSGKSTLLHVLITNLALHYHPHEIEFYLVDFKKGVEFKTYATHNLPHARAVAIETDREFGLSVLQRVDDELKRRGDIFRDLGVQDVAGYRQTDATEPIPRTLLLIDEFQEFFVEDDKLSQDAALLLDRLVRQGRAFGIHVILGSQTLSGAYSLARSTMGQMAVRVALQCSETDSMLILSDDNTAARLLSRPGEAIYNDQSGLVEGNNPFQIVWLPESVRDKYLTQISTLVEQTGYKPPEPQIVFEGNVPADIKRNQLLADELVSEPSEDKALATPAWLGDAIAIKDPTAAVFRRQSGSNLIMIGQREEASLAMQAVSIISLAAQLPSQPPDDARFFIFDGLPADSIHAGYFQKLARYIPHDVQVVGWHDVEAAMSEIGTELERRQDENITDTSPIYLFVFGLQRFRMLRQEEEFGFGSMEDTDKPTSADKHFGNVLRDGPPHGIHSVIWCDTANNLARAVDRKTMREFDMRILFQMSSTDSSNLIDSPAASMLGTQRALFFSEDDGILEKFRPYAVPDTDWLEKASKALRGETASV